MAPSSPSPDRVSGPETCCAAATNLMAFPSGQPDLILRVCQVCGRRHFELTVDPGQFGITLKGL